MTAAVAVRGVTKVYPSRRREGRRTNKIALDRVSLELAAGEAVAILGANGAGKSTLLRLIAGLTQPTSGTIETSGRLAALLELGNHFHRDLTGRENAELAAMIAGRTAREARSRIPMITDFAGLGDVIDEPLHSYSSGMRARLAFAVATDTPADVVLVDEIFAVGDLGFQRRCLDRMRALRESGVTFVVVTHDPELAAAECDRAGWLHGGQLLVLGEARGVVARYRDSMREQAVAATAHLAAEETASGATLVSGKNRLGTGEVELSAVEVTLADGGSAALMQPGDGVLMSAVVTAGTWRGRGYVSASIASEAGDVLVDTSVPIVVDAAELAVSLRVPRLDLGPGRYYLNAGVYDERWSTFDYHFDVYPLVVGGVRRGHGLLSPPLRWSAGKPIVGKEGSR